MVTLKAHFDGKTIVPDEPVDLPINQQLQVILLESVPSQANRIEPAATDKPNTHWQSQIGIGLPLPQNHKPRFNSNDDLWDKSK